MLEIKIQTRGNKSVSFEIYSSFFTLKIKMIVVLKESTGSLSLFWFKMVALWGQVIDDITH